LVAADAAEARAQWIAVFGRDRADLGPGHAAELAAREATRNRQDRSRGRTAAAPLRRVAPMPSVPRPEAERRGPSLAHGAAAPGIGR
ncbi:MAG: TrwC relaxase, partial [Blastococcus sp.]|nr:TrwC relaxase [Blastococcus sp.]